jgi:putative SOS response-associated peptidase YedK
VVADDVGVCGRVTLTRPDFAAVVLALRGLADPGAPARYVPRYNLAPADLLWGRSGADVSRRVRLLRWGLIPPWGGATALANARSETAARKPAFRDAFARGRCVVAVDGFYEWTGPPRRRLPIWFHAPDRSVFGLAAIGTEVVDPTSGELELRVALLTTEPNPMVAAYHDRMPVLLRGDAIDAWLDPAPRAPAELTELLGPAPPESLVATPVSPRVNRAEFDDPTCIEPVPHQGELFGSRAGSGSRPDPAR